MNTNDLLLKDEVFKIVGGAFEVLNTIGHGLHEKIYENALTVEFRLNNIPYVQQPSFVVAYKGHEVGLFVPDLIAFGTVIVDPKTIDCITDRERGQMINYLRICKLRVAVLLNFKNPKLEWERVVL